MCTKSEISVIFVFFKKLFDLREYSSHSQVSVACFTEGCAWDMLFIASNTVHFARVFEHNFSKESSKYVSLAHQAYCL